MKLSLLVFLFVAQCHGIFAQSTKPVNRQKLIVAEYRIDTPKVANYTYLVSYNFENGNLKSKDTILGAAAIKKDKRGSFTSYMRLEFGKNFIYKKRYVVSSTGNVIDLEKKELLNENGWEFIDTSGNTLIFYRENILTGSGYLSLDLSTGQFGVISAKKLDRDKNERSSPDNKHYLSIDRVEKLYEICLFECDSTDLRTTKETIVFDAGHGPNITSDSKATIATYWLNNTVFLYAVHNNNSEFSSHTGREEIYQSPYTTVTLRQYDITSKSDNVFFIIDSVKQAGINDQFIKDGIGQLLYRTSCLDYFQIDTLKETLADYPFYELGYGFTVKIKHHPDGDILKYRNVEIGKTKSGRIISGKGIIAVAEDENVITVWSDVTKMWTTIKIPWVNRIIGWIDED